ncbi:AAA family ATPase [Streptomyces xanthochromogenes]|uniref:nucleotide-binding protein n=1 Tax=Streptomyces xanthochromogenes TaxID=67384 RepID=UPI0037F67C52
MAFKIAVAMFKGGACKTTVSLALAEAAAEAGLDVEAIDTDPMGGLTRWSLGAEEESRPLRMAVTGMPSAKQLSDRIASATSHRDLVVIDGPPPGALAIAKAAIEAADFVLLACPARPADQDSVPATLAAVREAGKPFNGVLTCARKTLLTETGRITLQGMGVPLLKTELDLSDLVADNYLHRSRGPLRRFGIDLFDEISTKIG